MGKLNKELSADGSRSVVIRLDAPTMIAVKVLAAQSNAKIQETVVKCVRVGIEKLNNNQMGNQNGKT